MVGSAAETTDDPVSCHEVAVCYLFFDGVDHPAIRMVDWSELFQVIVVHRVLFHLNGHLLRPRLRGLAQTALMLREIAILEREWAAPLVNGLFGLGEEWLLEVGVKRVVTAGGGLVVLEVSVVVTERTIADLARADVAVVACSGEVEV